MKGSLHVLITNAWYPKPGSEEAFVKLWNEKIYKLATEMGSDRSGLYYNEESDMYLSSLFFPTKEEAERFLKAEKCQKATQELNRLCLVPVRKELYDILKKAI